ncbi:hypothetical protein CYCD_03140 [Tenuifilaceae bacterium CYCD]|nr:hypothetical protein CYCD_03140 [Tenuifilaceae bacterium CYCD]
MHKKLLKFSFIDFLLFTVFALILFIAVTFVMSLVIGKSFLSLIEKQWIVLVGYTLIFSVIQAAFNKNGALCITASECVAKCNDHLDEIILSKGYIATKKIGNETTYNRKTKIGRFFNFFLRESIVVRSEMEMITVFSRRNTLNQLENRINRLGSYEH